MRWIYGAAWLLTALISGCGGDGGKAQDVAVSLREWSVTLPLEEAAEGRYRFQVTNEGAETHELVIVKSDLPPAELPVREGKVVEEQVNVVDRLDPIEPGATGDLSRELTPGKYLLICNLTAGHYANGMVAFLLIEP